MKGLSSAANATLLAAASAAAGPYEGLAKHIATALSANKLHGDAVKAERVTLWDSFKSAIEVAQTNGHTAATMRAGLEIACLQAGIPAGSFRGYVSTVESLAVDYFAGENGITATRLAEISVKDARELYQSDDARLLSDAKAKLAAATAGWSVENILKLAEVAATIAAPVVKAKKVKAA